MRKKNVSRYLYSEWVIRDIVNLTEYNILMDDSSKRIDIA